MIRVIRWICVLGSAAVYFVVLSPGRVNATPPQCDEEVCLSDSVDCDAECGIGSTLTTCIEFMDLSQSGECNLADYQIADPIGNNDLEYSGTPEVGEPDFWNFVDAMNDAYAAGSDDGTISGATAGLDVLAAYGFMPEANYYINWADGNQSSAGPNSFGMSPMNIWWYWPSLSFPSCAEKQARLNDLSKASRGAWWGAGLSGFGATLAALIPGGQYAAVGFGATAFGYTVVAADLGDKYNWLNDNVPCIPRIAG